MTWQQALALAASLGVMVVPAAADSDLPPPQYDIGGVTEADALVAYSDRFGNDSAPLISVPYGTAKAECDRIHSERYATPYPEGNDFWNVLVGCLIRDADMGRPIIVYSYDPTRPDLAVRLIRHEAGHLLGWPAEHPR